MTHVFYMWQCFYRLNQLLLVLVTAWLMTSSHIVLGQETADTGGEILFARLANGAPGSEGMYVIDADGNNERPLFLFSEIGLPYDLDIGGFRCPAWSPDGTQIAFNGSTGSINYLAVVDVDGSDVQRILETEANDSQRILQFHYPEWVPGSNRISFGFTEASSVTGHVTANGVRVIDLDSSEVVTIRNDVSLTYDDGSPHILGDILPNFIALAHSWSPDGSQIAISSYNDLVYLTDAAGTHLIPLESSQFASSDVDWSPDGQQLASSLRNIVAYSPESSGESDVLMEPDWPTAVYIESLAWSPDGQEIAYTTLWNEIANGEFINWFTISVVDVTTGAVSEIARTPKFSPRQYPYNIACLDWRPAGAEPLPPPAPTAILPPTQTPSPTCTVTAPQNVNTRSAPSTSAAVTGSITSGENVEVNGQIEAEGYLWYRLNAEEWVRSDVVTSSNCTDLTILTR